MRQKHSLLQAFLQLKVTMEHQKHYNGSKFTEDSSPTFYPR